LLLVTAIHSFSFRDSEIQVHLILRSDSKRKTNNSRRVYIDFSGNVSTITLSSASTTQLEEQTIVDCSDFICHEQGLTKKLLWVFENGEVQPNNHMILHSFPFPSPDESRLDIDSWNGNAYQNPTLTVLLCSRTRPIHQMYKLYHAALCRQKSCHVPLAKQHGLFGQEVRTCSLVHFTHP